MVNIPSFTASLSIRAMEQVHYNKKNTSTHFNSHNSIYPSLMSYDDCLCQCYTCWQLPEGGCDPATCLTFPPHDKCMKQCLEWN